MATAPDELTFEEASAPAAEAPEEITFEEGHGLNKEALHEGIQASIGATGLLNTLIRNPLVGAAAEGGRAEAVQQRAEAIHEGIQTGIGANNLLFGSTAPGAPRFGILTNPAVVAGSQMGQAQGPRIRQQLLNEQVARAAGVAGGGEVSAPVAPPPEDLTPGLKPAGPYQELTAKVRGLPIVGPTLARGMEETQLPYEVRRQATKEPPPDTIFEAIQEGTRDVIAPFAKPEMIALMATTEGLGEVAPIVNRAIQGYFGVTAGKAVVAAMPELADAKTTPEKIKVLTGILGSGLIAVLAGKSAVGPRVAPTTPGLSRARFREQVRDEAIERGEKPDLLNLETKAERETREGVQQIMTERGVDKETAVQILIAENKAALTRGTEVKGGVTATELPLEVTPETAAPTRLPGLKTEKPDLKGRWRFTVDDGTGTTFTMPAGSTPEAIISMGNRRSAPGIFGDLDRLDKMSSEEFTKIIKSYGHDDASNEEISRVFTEDDAPKLLEIRNKSISEGERLQSELEAAVKSGDEKKMNEVMMAQGQHQLKAQTINEWLAKIPEVAEKLKGLDANEVKTKLQELYGPKTEVKPAEPAPAAPAEPTPAAAPVNPAAAKVEGEVQKVAATEGQRPAKEVKAELVSRLEKAIEAAPNEADVRAKTATKVSGEVYETQPFTGEKITIDIPGDGEFTVWNTKENLTELLSRAKRISTAPGAPVKVSRRGVSAEQGKQFLKEAETKPVAAETTERTEPAISPEEQHGGEAGAGIRAHGTDTGLPPGVPTGGPDFVSELMAASQRLGTIIRTRVTMAAGTLGQYVRSRRGGVMMADKIEVGNLVNQSTIAHEMGHDIDQYLWPAIDLDYSMKSLAARAGVPGNGRELHNELMKVSTYMRGEVKGSPRYVQYRKRAAELIADHFALYAHDPTTARALAPKWTKALEDAIARSPDAKNTIAELHAGSVTPAPGGAAQPPTGPAAGMPGRVPPVLPPPMASPEANLFHTGAGLVKGLIRKFKEKVIQAQIVADRWNRLVPDKADRNDVGAFVEGTGNLEIPGDTIDAVKARMTPAKYKMVKLYKTAIETVRGEINAYMHGMTDGEYLDFIKDYLPHFYDTKSSKGQAALGNFLKNSPNAKQRKIPTLQEALTFGLTPITQDPAVLYQLHSRINWRVATNRMLVGELGKMVTANGDPVLVPWGKAPVGYVRSDNPLIQRTYAMQSKGATQLWRGGAGIHPDAWLAVRQMLETPTDSTLAQYYDVFNSLTRANAFAFSAFHDVTLRAAASGTGILGASGAKYLNPFRGLFRVLEKNPLTGELEMFSSTRKLGKQLLQDEAAAMDAARHGLVFSWNDSDSYQMNARDFLDRQAAKWREHPLAGPATRWARDFQHWRQQGLWKNTHDAYKIIAFHDLSSKALRDAPPGTNPTVVKEQIASLLNDAFGGQEWQTKFWLSPANRRVLARFFLAPDWTLSTLRSVPGASDIMSTVRQAPRLAGGPAIPAEFEGMGGNWKRARFWGAEVAALAIGTLATQYAIHQAFGKKERGDKEWTWENEYGQRTRVDLTPIMRKLPWKDKNDPTRYYLNLAKRPQELVGWFIQPEKNIYSKLARPVAEVMRQITGMEGDFPTQWKRDHETFIESIPQRALKAAGTAVPFTFSGNQFAMSLPYRKGMTKYKAQQAFESVYELQADPGVWPAARAFLRGVPNPHGTMREMVEQLSDAAERNGVPAEKIRVRALSVIRGKYNGQFEKASKALDANPHDKKAMKDLEKASEALHNLGSSGRQIYESMKRRQELAPREP